MNITVIGHICRDTILRPGEEKPGTTQYGGIAYTVAALAGLMGKNDAIYPVFGVGEEDYDAVCGMLSAFECVSTEGVFRVKSRMNEVTLAYKEPDTPRFECSEHIAEPIPFAKIKPFLDADGVLVNMISGSDISLETLDQVRMTVRDARVPVHFDFHSLTLGIQNKGKRFRRPLTDWRRWAFFLHSVQMSEEEAQGLSSERYDETTLINQLMPLMVNVLIITRGARGATLIVQDQHKRLTRTEIAGISGEVVDTTGCGDVFGAVYLRTFVQSKDPVASARTANTIAGLHATLPVAGKTASLFSRLREMVDIPPSDAAASTVGA